jgi:hypothetical protein
VPLVDDTDAAPGHGDAGADSYVGYDNFANRMTWRSLDAPRQYRVLIQFSSWGLGVGHTSMRAADDGWALQSFSGGADLTPFHNEVIQLATDGSGRVRRLFHHRSVERSYYDTPRPNISVDGRFVAFTSNWGGQARTDLFVAKIQPATASPAPSPTPSATPAPSPTPTPTPTPTPDSGALTTSITSPTSGAQFGATANITITAVASATSGTVTKVEFYSGATWLYTDTTAPYTCLWNNVGAGSYTLTTKATDAAGRSATSGAVTVQVKKATGTVGRAKKNAQTLSNQLSETLTSSDAQSAESLVAPTASATQLSAVVADVKQAYDDFLDERSSYVAAAKIESELLGALTHARAAEAFAGGGPSLAVKRDLRTTVDHLELANVHMLYGDVRNPAEVTEFFVRQNYVDFLNREPDEAGLSFWVDQIERCADDEQCRQVMRINVSAAFFLSIEFQETGFLVHRVHRATSGRAPSLAEFSANTGEIARGVIVGQAGWSQKLERNKAVFYRQWVQRPEFTARYDGLTNAGYVDALIANAGVTVPPQERDSWVAMLNAGAPREAALRQLVEQEAFVRGQFASAFVMMQYMGYLRRDPDEGGYQHWLQKLNDFGGDFNRAEMVRAFLESIEYNQRFTNR